MREEYMKTALAIKKSKFTMAFTGAGISVPSGIPPFRGKDGLWEKYDPKFAEIGYFMSNPLDAWKTLKAVFYDMLTDAKPNEAHIVLAKLEKENMLHAIATQNIDALHTDAGSKVVYELHGNSKTLTCIKCGHKEKVTKEKLLTLPPKCEKCGEALKPDFVFFGEMLPEDAIYGAFDAAKKCEVCIIIGTGGEVMPAASIPHKAKENGALIIEINLTDSNYTKNTTDIFLQGSAEIVLKKLYDEIKQLS